MTSPLGEMTNSVPALVRDNMTAAEASTPAVPYPIGTPHVEPPSSPRPQTTAVAKMQIEPSASLEELSDSEPATMATSSNEVKTGYQTCASPLQTTLSTEDEASTQAVPYPQITPQIEPANSPRPQEPPVAVMQSEPSASPKALSDSEPTTLAISSNEVKAETHPTPIPSQSTPSIEEPTSFTGSRWFENVGEEMAQKIQDLVVNIHGDTAEARGQRSNDPGNFSDNASDHSRIDRRETFQGNFLSESTAYWRLPTSTSIGHYPSFVPSTPAPSRPHFSFEPPTNVFRQDDAVKITSYPPPGYHSLDTPPKNIRHNLHDDDRSTVRARNTRGMMGIFNGQSTPSSVSRKREVTTFQLEEIISTSDDIGNAPTSDTELGMDSFLDAGSNAVG